MSLGSSTKQVVPVVTAAAEIAPSKLDPNV
jgi:hypothetical protein